MKCENPPVSPLRNEMVIGPEPSPLGERKWAGGWSATGPPLKDQPPLRQASPARLGATGVRAARLRPIVGIRLDDGPDYLDDGHEKLCYADPPYTSFQCPAELPGRLDGPITFVHGTDRWVIARAHLPQIRKRTVLYRITGDLHDLTGVGLEAVAARQLGFVPTHGISAALEMARGLAGGAHRIGFLLSPPYFPVRVG